MIPLSPSSSASVILKAMEKGKSVGGAFGVQKLKHLACEFEEAVRGRGIGGAIYSVRKQFEDEASAVPFTV